MVFVSTLVTIVAAVLERFLQKSLDIKSENGIIV